MRQWAAIAWQRLHNEAAQHHILSINSSKLIPHLTIYITCLCVPCTASAPTSLHSFTPPSTLSLLAGKVELPPVRGAGYEPSAASGEPTGVALFGMKRFSLIDYFSRSRGHRGLLSSICHDYNYYSNEDSVDYAVYCLIAILPTFA